MKKSANKIILTTKKGNDKKVGDVVWIRHFYQNMTLSTPERVVIKDNVDYFGIYFDAEKEALEYKKKYFHNEK